MATQTSSLWKTESSHGYPGMNGAATYSIFPTTNGLSPFGPFEPAAYYADPSTAAFYSSFAPGLTSPITGHPGSNQISGHLGGHCPSTALGPHSAPPGSGPSPYHHPALFYTPHPHVTFIAQPPPPGVSLPVSQSYGTSGPPGHGQVTGLTLSPNSVGNGTSGQVYHTHHTGHHGGTGHLTSSPVPGQAGSGGQQTQIQSWGQPHYLTTAGPQVMLNNPMNHVS